MSDKDNGMVKTLIEALTIISNALQKAHYDGANAPTQERIKEKMDAVLGALNNIALISAS